jgi:uncharacterized protein (TIGR02284 family)
MRNVQKKDTIIEKLSDVVELDFDAIEAYNAAIERLEKSDYKTQLRKFLADHERHVKELSEVIRREGGDPPTSGDIKQILTKGQVVIGGLAGDQAILKAMKMNEEQTNSMYEDMVNEDFPEDVHRILQSGLEDERRHRQWLINTIERNS